MTPVVVYLRPNGRPRAVMPADWPPDTLTEPRVGRDVGAEVDRLSGRYGPWCRPADLGVSNLFAWLAERGEFVPVAVVRALGERWRAERG